MTLPKDHGSSNGRVFQPVWRRGCFGHQKCPVLRVQWSLGLWKNNTPSARRFPHLSAVYTVKLQIITPRRKLRPRATKAVRMSRYDDISPGTKRLVGRETKRIQRGQCLHCKCCFTTSESTRKKDHGNKYIVPSIFGWNIKDQFSSLATLEFSSLLFSLGCSCQSNHQSDFLIVKFDTWKEGFFLEDACPRTCPNRTHPNILTKVWQRAISSWTTWIFTGFYCMNRFLITMGSTCVFFRCCHPKKKKQS